MFTDNNLVTTDSCPDLPDVPEGCDDIKKDDGLLTKSIAEKEADLIAVCETCNLAIDYGAWLPD